MKLFSTGFAVTALATVGLASPSASAETIFGLTTGNQITVFDSAAPSIALDAGRIRGLGAGENLLAIDFRPATGEVYALGDFDNLYTIDQSTFAATLVGSFSPSLKGTSFGFDFNPAFMNGTFARIISDTDDNRVVSGDDGSYLAPVEKTDVFYASGDPNQGVNPNIAAIAYANNVANAVSTQQYGIDATLGVLVTVANNAGTLNTVGSLGVSPLTSELGLDISGATGIAYANLQNGPNSNLFTIDLSTGAATFVGQITAGELIRDITVIPEPGSIALMLIGGLVLASRRKIV